MATESTSAPFCNYPSHQCYGFYYLVLDNVAPGDFTLRGWTTDYILQSDVSDVCGVIGHPNRGGGASALFLSLLATPAVFSRKFPPPPSSSSLLFSSPLPPSSHTTTKSSCQCILFLHTPPLPP